MAARATKAGNDEREFIKRILSTREGYEEEAIRHKFLLDAYSGTGGFQGRVRQPFAGFWGAASEIYSSGLLADLLVDRYERDLDTYLDRFPREDAEKFRRRVAAVHYPNYIAPAIDVPLSFLFRRELTRPSEGVPASEELERWMDNANGAGEPWDKMLREVIALRAMILGWTPVLLTVPAAKQTRLGKDGTPYRTAADDQAENRMPRALPLFPANLLDWHVDDEGVTQWMKTRIDYSRRDDPFGPCVKRSRITVWLRELSQEGVELGALEEGAAPTVVQAPSVQWFDIAWDDGGQPRIVDKGTGRHGFGDVPIPVLRRKPVPDDPMRGIPHAGSACDEARRLFNLGSEIDHHMRSSTFAFLQYPVKPGTKPGSVKLGAGNALPLDNDSRHEFKYVSPDPSVCDSYEKRIAKIIEEIYRIQKMEFTRGTTQGQSGTARSFEFESTNRMIADIAAQVAAFDEQTRRLVARVMSNVEPGSDEEREIRTIAPNRFDVSEMLKEIEEAQAAVDLELGPTATGMIKKRIALGMLPNISDEEKKKIEGEIDELAKKAEDQKDQQHAAELEAKRAFGAGEGDDAPPFAGEGDDEGGGAPAPAGGKPPFPPKKGAPVKGKKSIVPKVAKP